MPSRGVNKVILIGNLGAAPEVRHTPDGVAVAIFNLATSESWNDRTSGEKQERTEWHRLVVWRKLAENAGQYLKKGSKIYVEGKLQTRSWDDQSGQKRYTTEVVVNDFQMLDSRNEAGAGGGGFLLLYAPLAAQDNVRNALSNLRELPFLFERDGSRVVFDLGRSK